MGAGTLRFEPFQPHAILGDGVTLDTLAFGSQPEPGTWMLLGPGLLALVGLRLPETVAQAAKLVPNSSWRSTKHPLIGVTRISGCPRIITTLHWLMFTCMNCGGEVYKVHRSFLERLTYASAYTCRDCDVRIRRFRWLVSCLRFIVSRHTTCPSCGIDWVNPAHTPANKKDRFREVSKHPLSVIQQFFRARRLKCSVCRMSYHDLRALRRDQATATRELATK